LSKATSAVNEAMKTIRLEASDKTLIVKVLCLGTRATHAAEKTGKSNRKGSKYFTLQQDDTLLALHDVTFSTSQLRSRAAC
jgi:hypothetical protein